MENALMQILDVLHAFQHLHAHFAKWDTSSIIQDYVSSAHRLSRTVGNAFLTQYAPVACIPLFLFLILPHLANPVETLYQIVIHVLQLQPAIYALIRHFLWMASNNAKAVHLQLVTANIVVLLIFVLAALIIPWSSMIAQFNVNLAPNLFNTAKLV